MNDNARQMEMEKCLEQINNAIKEYNNTELNILCEELQNAIYAIQENEVDQDGIEIDFEGYSKDISKLIDLFTDIKNRIANINQ
jgi:hypothetical protein